MVKTGSGRALYAVRGGTYVLKLVGEVRVPMCATLDRFIEKMFQSADFQNVLVDLSDVHIIDSTALGLLAKIAIYCEKRVPDKPVIFSPRNDITRILESMGFPQIFDIRTDDTIEKPGGIDAHESTPLSAVPRVPCSEANACEKVLEAHRILMGMNQQNHDTFKDVVIALEQASSTPAGDDCSCEDVHRVLGGKGC